MFACLLIGDERFIEISELLVFYSIKWELGDGGVIYIDFDSIGDRIQVLIYELKLREIQARIGVAPTRFSSFVAAHTADVETPVTISSAQLETFLADQSISYLPISGKNRERLEMLGLRTLGQVAGIDVREPRKSIWTRGPIHVGIGAWNRLDAAAIPTPVHRRGRGRLADECLG